MAPPATLSGGVRTRLSVMMFMQYAYNGVWIIPLVTYLSTVGYTGANIGAAYGTFALGCIIAPFIVGMIADRFVPAQIMLGLCNILSGVFLYLAAKMSVDAEGAAHMKGGVTDLGPMYWMLLLHFIAYMPSWALTNTIAMRQMSDPGKQFPSIRVMGTIGWIAVGFLALAGTQINSVFGIETPFEKSPMPMYIGAAIGIFAGIFSFFLPHTPPAGKHQKVTVGDIVGAKAFSLLKDRNFAMFVLASFLVFFPGLFYWNYGNLFLNELEISYAMTVQTTGQMIEMLFLFIMPWFFMRFGVKTMLLMGLCAWCARFVCFRLGDWDTTLTATFVVMGVLLHGPCFDFFFVTGQLYTNKKASIDIQAQAQGLIFLTTFGLGWYFATILAGWVVDQNVITEVVDGVETAAGHNWDMIWLWPVCMAAAVIVLFFVTFNDKMSVLEDEAPAEEAPAEA